MADSKHIELIQAAISRVAGNSFLIKGWSITLTTAILGFALKDGGPSFALLGLAPVTIFWALDAYYLALEKGFRDLHSKAVNDYQAGKPPSFDMSPAASGRSAVVIGRAFRPAVVLTHFTLVALLAGYWLLA